jgi:enediyne biosynthesis protein E4
MGSGTGILTLMIQSSYLHTDYCYSLHWCQLFILVLSLIIWGCAAEEETKQTLFEKLDSSETGIQFENMLTPTEEFNMYIFRNFYNGGGIAVGDVSGNGLPDIFLTGNMVSNRLYINKGDYRFEDVTD